VRRNEWLLNCYSLAMHVSGMALATGSSRATCLMHRSIDFIFAYRSLVHALAASAVPLKNSTTI
jgi:hypothetical protein